MKKIILAVLTLGVLVSCSSSPQASACRNGCESRARHSAEDIANCKKMCDRYEK